MTLHEPATFFTDLLLAALGVVFAVRIARDKNRTNSRRWWIASMSLMAASALFGGFYHGFAPEFPSIEPWWWRTVLWIICGLGFAMAMSLLHELKPKHLPVWRAIIAIKFLIFTTSVLFAPEFVVAMADYGSAMLAWVVAALMIHRPWRGPMLAGVGLSLLAGVVQQAQWSLSEHFNHNDVFHLIQALALVAFYAGGKRLC